MTRPEHADLGQLLHELERQGVIKPEEVLRCCKKVFARIYRYQDAQLLWVAKHRGYSQDGIVTVPAAAMEITADMRIGSLLAVTTCWHCGRSWLFTLESSMTIGAVPGLPPQFAEVAD
jgi:hypothetical protein